MQAGTYTLQLYCDNESDKHEWGEFPHEYVHELGSKCRKMARKAGWVKMGELDLCPKCAKLKPSKIKNSV